ncbi:MAG: helix-turn-helix transcriptional regulator [Pseudomonadota bacterium]
MNDSPPHVIIQKGNSLRESFSLLQHMPGMIVVKDLHSRIIVISDYFAYLVGVNNEEKSDRITDYDVHCESIKLADMFVQHDQQTIKNKREVLTLDICKYTSGWKTLLSSKKPILNNNGEFTGVFAQSINISNTNMFKSCLSLKAADHLITGKEDVQSIYVLNDEHSPLPLTSRQQTCLFLLVRGKSMKEIASILGISVRTAEEHITTIRTKLDCNSRSQVIEKAINSGFLNFIPQEILYKRPDKRPAC